MTDALPQGWHRGGVTLRRAALGLAAIALAIALWKVVLAPFGFVPSASYDGEHFGIERYVSATDQDGDGIDDQADILASARAYVATGPRYRSAYFEGGWPDDGTGVCTDVVAFALLGAGYDLRELVDADIRQAPEAYGIDEPDPNIDYRRVRNLRAYFDRHAESLTLETDDIASWQPGDIVCYHEHIGIVSDRRNAAGVPFVIHHWGSLQHSFEEDRLAAFGRIEGHWRIS